MPLRIFIPLMLIKTGRTYPFWFTVDVFYNLLNQYNATSGTTGATNIVQLPLAFVRSGNVLTGDGKVYYVGGNGYNWSRTASSSTSARYLAFNSSGVYPSDSTGRYLGFPLRCLYPGNA